MTDSINVKPVVLIGAAGEMCRVAVERFAKASNAQLVLADLNTTVIESLAASFPSGRATTQKLDLFDETALANLISGAGLVVLGAGPYSKTSQPVVKACIKAKVPYLDFDDDVESTQDALNLNQEAKKAGVPLYIGCGASPGLSNVMIMDATSELDTVNSIDICWLVGDEASVGKAVLQHLMHIAAGPCLTWVDSKPRVNESWVGTTYAPISEAPLRYALWGMLEQIWNGECTTGEVVTYLMNAITGTKIENRGNILVRATGMRGGVPTVITKRNPKNGKDSYLCQSMGTVTGTSTAAFMVMALEDGCKRSGVFCPEDWAKPDVFYRALERVGVPRNEIIESI
ncbi:Saccharopine dehydrogenase-domain-containing protein [Aspergillus transmontanensis]|uniref:Saccharopine dehydrogenase-domain-containing protein n=1 Tax=Aspergillus transmontanensis TaxID=1034304 RepID=A0A5N6VVT8_9EURO|nr:Saccharopine dehydrogenase-domain-containing protein [Aspergillus transmontanensis]